MSGPKNEGRAEGFLADCARIYLEWHKRAQAVDTEGLLALYHKEAVLRRARLCRRSLMTSPTVCSAAMRSCAIFFGQGGRRRPNHLVRWYRTGDWLTDGRRLLVWEYPRQAPDGDQVDLVEVMEVAGGLIACHRIYWGWKGCTLIAPTFARRGPTA